MTCEERLRTELLAVPAVTAALPGGIWLRLQQLANLTYPIACLERIATTRIYAQNTAPAEWGTNGFVRFQITCYSNDAANGRALAIAACDAVRAALKQVDLANSTFKNASNFVLDERPAIVPTTTLPVFGQLLDMRLFFGDV